MTASAHTEDLEAILAACWARLEQAAGDRRDAFHIMQVASVGLDGGARLRSVVLRAVEPDERLLAFHSDARSPKIVEIEREPRISLLFYDKEAGLQLRLEGTAEVHRCDDRAETAWRAGRRFARRCYLQTQGPSSPADQPTSGLPTELEQREPTEEELSAGRENFCVVTCCVRRLDWFSLKHDGHRRAEFCWPDGDDQAGATSHSRWLVP